jgi:hypothetical protein
MKGRLIASIIAIIAVVTGAVSCLSKGGKADALPKTVSFNFHIRPILSDKCFKCHGPDRGQRQAGLRLDIPDSAFAPLKETKGAFALVPGKPELSEVYKRISSTDSSYMMPSPDAHLGALSEYEIKLFKKWIQQGSKYESHWAFTAPVKAEIPVVNENAWVKNEIDHFILDKMHTKGLEPNEEADKERLLKRICFAITGLLPSFDMMDKFLADKSEKA